MAFAATTRGLPAEGRLDLRQLRALVTLTLGQALRPGLDVSSGTHTRPLLQLPLSLGVLGLLSLPNAWRSADLASYLVLVFTGGLMLTTFLVLPETQAARERSLDVLACRPVSLRTMLAARAVALGTLAGLIGLFFGGVSLVGASLVFATPVPTLLLLLLSLAAQGFVTAVLWLTCMLALLRKVSVERLRKTAQRMFLGFVAIVAIASLSLGSSGARFDAGLHAWVWLLPSSWFATLFVPGAPVPVLTRLGVVALLAVATATMLSSRLAIRQGALLETAFSQPADSVGPSRTVRALQRLSRHSLGRRLLPAPVAALLAATASSCEREEISRARTSALLVTSVLAFVFGLVAHQPFMAALLAMLSLSTTLEALESSRQSSNAPASWLFHVAPLEGRHALRALELAALMRGSLVPLALAAVLVAVQTHPALAIVLAAAGMITARAVLAFAIVLTPSPPLAREQRAMQPLVSLVLTLGLMVAGSVIGTLLTLLFGAFPTAAMAASVMLAAGLAAVQYGLGRWAAHRIEHAEYPY